MHKSHTKMIYSLSLAALSGKFYVGLNLFHVLTVPLNSTVSNIKCHRSKEIHVSLSLLIWCSSVIDLWKKLYVRNAVYTVLYEVLQEMHEKCCGVNTHFEKSMGSMYFAYKALFPLWFCLDHRGNIIKAPVLQTFSRIACDSKAKHTHLSDRQLRL